MVHKLRTGQEVWDLMMMTSLIFLCINSKHKTSKGIAHPLGQFLQRVWYYLILGTVSISNMKGVSFLQESC